MDDKIKETILNPILKGNPITVLVLGICSALARYKVLQDNTLFQKEAFQKADYCN